MTQRLNELITLLKGHRVFIQTHNFPDPDAIASAYGLQVLLAKFGIDTTICHHGNDERSSTANMITELGIEMFADKSLDDMTEEDYIVTVDAQKGNSNILDLIGNEVACIDHHPTFCEVEDYKFKDVRIVGSCATLIAEYYRANNVEMPENVATALLYGLKMDTKDFTRGVTELDIDIFGYLFTRANNQLIRRFQASVFQYDELSAYVNSLRNVEIYNGIGFAYLDIYCADALAATISDFILDLDVVYFVVVYSRRGAGLKFSVRSELEELDAGAIVERALSDVGSGGGHSTMAGGYAEEAKLLNIDSDINKAVRKLFMDVVGKYVDPESLSTYKTAELKL